MSPVRPATPPPYGTPQPALGPPRFVLRGTSGEHVLEPGREIGVGRDPAKVAILLAEPRVSGLHATIKLDGAGVWVRDEASNNGVWISGQRIPAGTWTVVPAGSPLRFGPIEFVLEVTRGA